MLAYVYYLTNYLSFQILLYNTLLAEIHTSLLDLQRGIKGLVVMSLELEHIFLCIYEGRVPAAWLKGMYPEAILWPYTWHWQQGLLHDNIIALVNWLHVYYILAILVHALYLHWLFRCICIHTAVISFVMSVCLPTLLCAYVRITLTRRVFVNLLFGIITIICQKASDIG